MVIILAAPSQIVEEIVCTVSVWRKMALTLGDRGMEAVYNPVQLIAMVNEGDKEIHIQFVQREVGGVWAVTLERVDSCTV